MDSLSAAFPPTDIDSLLITQCVFSFGGEVRGEDTFELVLSLLSLNNSSSEINGKTFILE